MGRTYALGHRISCHYGPQLRNLWNLPLQRLELYCNPFERPEGSYKVSSQATCIGTEWIGLERHFEVIEETIPFRILKNREYLSILKQYFLGATQEIDRNACVLIDYLNSKPNYFHWLLDALPRIFAAETHKEATGQDVCIVIPETLTPWQWDSLKYLGIQPDQLIRVPSVSAVRSWSFERLISTFSHRHIRYSSTGHFDAFSPTAILELSNRLLRGAPGVETTERLTPRLYISRGDARLRRVQNEDDVIDFLSHYGFKIVCPDELPLAQQIHLFRQASHVISAHGGALTNLMHVSPGCQILEIFQTGHGIRPDFFQLAAIKGALYSFTQASSLNRQNDIAVDLDILRNFLDASL